MSPECQSRGKGGHNWQRTTTTAAKRSSSSSSKANVARCQRICLANLCGIRIGCDSNNNNNNPWHPVTPLPYQTPLGSLPPFTLSVLSLITDNNELPPFVFAAKWRQLWIRISNFAAIATVVPIPHVLPPSP